VLRLSPGLHATLRAAARDAGLSLNDYCVHKLAASSANPALPSAAAVVDRSAQILGTDLLGVVAYGSWARGEATATSDVDVLVVADAKAAITRELYRRWDARPLTWEGRPVEPHFVRLRGADAPATSLWAEAALDGIVLFERGLGLSARLAAVRRDIASGRLVRRLAHGQPYWAEVA
jgi:nucleotidyltransferase-like protein/HicB-like protein involved in pilus formation